MKSLFCLLVGLACLLPASLHAQDPLVGDWKTNIPGDQGQMMPMKVSIKADGTYSLDYGMDGVVDVNGAYQRNGENMTIWDVSGQSDCVEKKGVYKVEIAADGKSYSMTRVSDDCAMRGGPEGKIAFQRL